MEHSASPTTESSLDDDGENLLFSALVGAIASLVLSPVPGSPILGGALAGYLTGTDRTLGTKSGALSGLFMGLVSTLLAVVFLGIFGIFGLFAFAGAPRAFGLGALGFLTLAIFGLLIGLVYTVGLGALGGYLGAYLNEEFN